MFYYANVLPERGEPIGDEPNAVRLTLTSDLRLRLPLLAHLASEHGITITADVPDGTITWLADPCEPGLYSLPQENLRYSGRIYGATFHVYDGSLRIAGYLNADQTVGVSSASFAVERLLAEKSDELTKAPRSDYEKLIAAYRDQDALKAENERLRAHMLELRAVIDNLCRIKEDEDPEFAKEPEVARRAWAHAVMTLASF